MNDRHAGRAPQRLTLFAFAFAYAFAVAYAIMLFN
jgi:hypothetical protein